MPDNETTPGTAGANARLGDDGKGRDFNLEADKGCGACPLSRIPASVWKGLFRPPFRKRHPFIFWGLCLLALAAVAAVGRLAALPAPGERLALVSVVLGIV